jgi:hypothetical protein
MSLIISLLVLLFNLNFQKKMKNLLSKVHPIVPSLSLMGLLFIVALLITSCGTGYVTCDAYGDSGESVTVLEDDNV